MCVPLDDQENNICTMPSHISTRRSRASAMGDSHIAPHGNYMRMQCTHIATGTVAIYARGALCGSTTPCDLN